MSFESEVRSPEDRIHQTPASSPGQTQGAFDWRDVLAKSALFFFGIALWSKGLNFYAYYLLITAWIFAGGLGRFKETIKEPFVLAMLILCIVVALGILWSEDLKSGFRIWRRYFAFLVFIPYLSLLNKTRLPWAIVGLFIGYFGALAIGVYQWIIIGVQGIPALAMSYISFSSTLGIGVLLSIYLAVTSKNKKSMSALWLLALFLLFIQFNQNARSALLATLLSLLLLLFLFYKAGTRTPLAIMASLIIVIGVLVSNNTSFHERLAQAKSDIELSKTGYYGTSLGYRFAIWDVGLHGIVERPLFGYGTGMAASYFNKTIETYKGGTYRDLQKFEGGITYHYHNDWIEIGMHIGALGLVAYAFLLWGWFQTLRAHQLSILGATLVCFVFLSGLTDTFIAYRQAVYLLLAITAIGISWHKAYGANFILIKKQIVA